MSVAPLTALGLRIALASLVGLLMVVGPVLLVAAGGPGGRASVRAEIPESVMTRSAPPPLDRGARPPGAAAFAAPRAGHPATSPGNVTGTVALLNNTIVPFNFRPLNGIGPSAVAFDWANDQLYVVNELSSNVEVVSGVTYHILAQIPVGTYPDGIAFDPVNGNLFVANSYTDNVTVINGSTDTIQAEIPVGAGPFGVAVDARDGQVFVSNLLSDTVTVINGQNDSVVATLGVGHYPTGLAVDEANGDIYVANWENFGTGTQSTNVTVINGATDKVSGSVPVGPAPLSVAVDPLNGYVYVANSNFGAAPSGNNVTVIDGSTNHPIASTSVGGYPMAVLVDPENNTTFVADLTAGGSYISGINTSSNLTYPWSYHTGSTPIALAWDPIHGHLFVANQVSDNLTVIEPFSHQIVYTITAGYGPSGGAFDATNGVAYFANAASVDLGQVTGSTYHVAHYFPTGGKPNQVDVDSATERVFTTNSFAENITLFLDGGAEVTSSTSATEVAVLNGGTGHYAGAITTGFLPYGVATDTINSTVYVTYPYNGEVVVFNATSLAVVATISDPNAPTGVAFDPANDLVYVADEYSNDLLVINGTNEQVLTTIPVGTTPDAIAVDPVNGRLFVANLNATGAAMGNVTVVDPKLARSVSTIPVGFGPNAAVVDPANGNVYVANGYSNNVTVINGANDRVIGSVAVGAGPDGLTVDGATGAILVSNYFSGSLSILLPPAAAPTYSVTFSESGLPTGSNWTVTLNGTLRYATSGSIVFTMGDGTYNYTVGAPHGYFATPANGNATVNGHPVAKSIVFAVFVELFNVTFNETGLASGTTWSVSIAGTSNSSSGAAIDFRLKNGTYTFSVASVTGYNVSTPEGILNVRGAPVDQSVTYVPNGTTGPPVGTSHPPVSTLFGLPVTEAYLLLGVVAVAVGAALIGALLATRRRGPGTPPSAGEAPWEPAAEEPPPEAAPSEPPPPDTPPPP